MPFNTSADLNNEHKNIELKNQSYKLYYQEFEFGGYDNSAFESLSITMAYVVDPPEPSEIEKNSVYKNNPYGEIEVTAISQEIRMVSDNKNSLDSSRTKITTKNFLTVTSNQQLFSFVNKKIFFFTFENFNFQRANSGDQEVYICYSNLPSQVQEKLENINPTLAEWIQITDGQRGNNVYQLVPISEINQIQDSKIYFSQFKKPKNFTYFQLDHDRTWAKSASSGVKMFGDIFINNNLEKENAEIDILSPQNGLIAKFAPLFINDNRLYCYGETWDYNKTLPFQIIYKNLNKQYPYFKEISLKDILIDSEIEWNKAIYQLICTNLKLTQGYATAFGEYQKNINDQGLKIDPKSSIGAIRTLSEVSTIDPISLISGLDTFWKSKYPLNTRTNYYKIYKAVLVGLSEYIKNNYLIGQGGNRSHELYNLWTFELQTSITKSLRCAEPCLDKGDTCDPSVENFQYDKLDDIKVKIQSLWISPSYNNVKEKFYFYPNLLYLNLERLVDIDGLVPIAKLPNIITFNDLKIGDLSDVQNKSLDLTNYYITFHSAYEFDYYKWYTFGSINYSITQTKEITFNGSNNVEVEYAKPKTNERCGVATRPEAVWTPCPAEIFESEERTKHPEYSENDIASLFIVPNLNQNQKIKITNGKAEIKNIKWTFKYSRAFWCESQNAGIGLKLCLYTLTSYYELTYDYTIIEKQEENMDLTQIQYMLDKKTYTNLIKGILPIDKQYNSFKVMLTDESINFSDEIKFSCNPKQILLSGFWGSQFRISFSNNKNLDQENAWNTEWLDFSSRYNETKTLTKINV